MEIWFTRLPGNRCEIGVSGRQGPDLRLPPVPVGHLLPHDLLHAAVEQTLGLDEGFWGSIARGAPLGEAASSASPADGRPEAKKALNPIGDGVMEAEIKVTAAYRAWRGLPPRRGRAASPLTGEELVLAREAIERAAERWKNTPEGESLIWHW